MAPRPGAVHLESHGIVRTLRIKNARARNAFSVGMMRQLGEHVHALAEDDGGLLVLRGDQRAFCAGGDLVQVCGALGTPEHGQQMATAMRAVLLGLADLPHVSLAVLEGPALGGGAELAVAADLRHMGPDGRLHFVHTALGVIPGWGGETLLRRRVGGRALAVLLEARSLNAEEAGQLGLVDFVGPVEPVIDRLASRGAPVLRAVKRQLYGTEPAAAFASVWGGPAHRSALSRGGARGLS